MPRECQVGEVGLIGTFIGTGPGARAAAAAASFHLRRDRHSLGAFGDLPLDHAELTLRAATRVRNPG
ncbi:hypothetical protein ACWX0K_24260 (plasmid) [Nitrobacteraceae bacterium UC4446_H13]